MISSLQFLTQRWARFACVAALTLATGTAALAGGPVDQPTRQASSVTVVADRYIIKFREGANAQATNTAMTPAARLAAVGSRHGKTFQYVRAMSGGAHVVRLTADSTAFAAQSLAAGRTPEQTSRLIATQLMNDPDVQYVDPDVKMVPMLVPNDTFYGGSQWDLFEAAGGIDAPAAWDITTGSAAITVAVIDTGYRPHADLAGRFVQGYDFIHDATISNDGDGRDTDASDPGDYTGTTASSWHGTHVSGTIGANANNGQGIAGINWVSKILPARVLGAGGGYTSDIIDAMRWSAGIAVTGVPTNANPARVENLSLGGSGACSASLQSAINDVVARNTVVVVAAGNSNADISTQNPANCAGVVVVAATQRNGGRASFSNFGAGVTVAAPGVGILSTLNTGTTTPGSDSYASYSGTSMATPHVVGVVSLMLSQNPSMTVAQVIARLKATARSFPTGTGNDCTTAICGAGIVDAAAALTPVVVAPRINIAAQVNGGVATASSVFGAGFDAANANNGDHIGGSWGAGGSWADATRNAFPDTLRIDFPTAKSVSEIDVYTLQDNVSAPVEPTLDTTFTKYGLTAFDVQYLDPTTSTWITVPNGHAASNNKVWTQLTFQAVTTSAIRVVANGSVDGYTEVVEVEAYGDNAAAATALNVASSAAGSTASASSSLGDGFAPSLAINGNRRGSNWGTSGGWADATRYAFPDQLQVNFNQARAINEIDIFTVQDNASAPQDPTASMTFTKYGITAFDVQYWNGSSWVTVPGGSIEGNNKVWTKISFPSVATTAIRVNVRGGADGWSMVTQVEAYQMP